MITCGICREVSIPNKLTIGTDAEKQTNEDS